MPVISDGQGKPIRRGCQGKSDLGIGVCLAPVKFVERMRMANSNLPETISLIGMPGAGKSTVGVLLAKMAGLGFRDTDLDIQLHAKATLQEILEREGHLSLRAIEEGILLEIPLSNLSAIRVRLKREDQVSLLLVHLCERRAFHRARVEHRRRQSLPLQGSRQNLVPVDVSGEDRGDSIGNV